MEGGLTPKEGQVRMLRVNGDGDTAYKMSDLRETE